MNFFRDYFKTLSCGIQNMNIDMLDQAVNVIRSMKRAGGKVIIAGNGASAAIASHVSVDLTKNTGVKAINFNEADLITCFSNDYGYDKWVEKAIGFYADPKDLVILVSSSGASKNIINGARKAKKMGLKVITFSGFKPDNPLRKLGDINFWVDSRVYNMVEITHSAWLLAMVDRLSKS